jgi:hypothetical protein
VVTFELDPHGELMAVTPGGPLQDRPRDWLVWHMTHIENLDSIAQMGEIRSTSHAPPHVNIANLDVKGVMIRTCGSFSAWWRECGAPFRG